MKKLLVCALLLAATLSAVAQNPKREFRGAWMHTVWQNGYHDRSTKENMEYLRDQLDILQQAGCNAVIFQVRPQADAFYESRLEPWSRFLTDGGKAPEPMWDPLEFMIEECHARGMELHAWLNPYRVTTSKNQRLPANHIYHQHKDWFVTYDGKIYFDPGLPECRDFIVKVVQDIVKRYDVDGIHFDDYFYPYPVKGVEFPDSRSFSRYGRGMNRNDWRRQNVDKLIKEVHATILTTKPWVVFGISPFGIWRNKSSDPNGSDTNGLQNYDDLYADVLLWARSGWVDYLLPQLYWELEHKKASYMVLIDWWNNHTEGRNMYIGQDIAVTMKKPDIEPSTEATQLRHKVNLSRGYEHIGGNCWWPAYSLTENHYGVADSLAMDLQSTIALVPTYPWINSDKPAAPTNVKVSGKRISWKQPRIIHSPADAVKFVVYRFDSVEAIDLEAADAIVAVTYKDKYEATEPGVYVVTSLSRVNQESDPAEPVVVK